MRLRPNEQSSDTKFRLLDVVPSVGKDFAKALAIGCQNCLIPRPIKALMPIYTTLVHPGKAIHLAVLAGYDRVGF